MNVAQEACDRGAFIVDGRICLIDSPRRLRLERGRRQVRVEYRMGEGTGNEEFPLRGIGDNGRFLDLLREREIETIHTAVLLRALPPDLRVLLAPPVIFSDPGIMGFFLVAALILLERGQGVLDVIFVTPLRLHEYLAAKVTAVTLLATSSSLAGGALVHALVLGWLWRRFEGRSG